MITAPIVLMLEDDAERLERFHAVATRLGVELVVWRSAHVMLAELASYLSSAVLITLDHDIEPESASSADPGDGLLVAKHLATLPPAGPVVIHTSNGDRCEMLQGEFDLAGWTHHRVVPFGDDWIETDWFRLVKRLLRKRSTPQ